MTEHSLSSALPSGDLQVIERYLRSRPTALSDIQAASSLWKAIADECLRRRLSDITDLLSNDALKAIASGQVDFPAVCERLAR